MFDTKSYVPVSLTKESNKSVLLKNENRNTTPYFNTIADEKKIGVPAINKTPQRETGNYSSLLK